MHPFTIAALFTGVALACLLVAEQRDSALGKWLTKPFASAGFIAAALTWGWPSTPFSIAILVALLLSAAGDLLLIPKSTKYFAAGLVSFLLGHLGFGAAFVARGVNPLWLGVAVLPVGGLALLIHRWLREHVPDRLRIPVIAYIVVISVMVVGAAGTFGFRGDRQGLLLLAGALSFFASDIAVARNRFVSEGFVNRLWGLPLYYGAQILFCLSLGQTG